MAKANIDTPSGAKIIVEGTAEEISAVLAAIQRRQSSRSGSGSSNPKNDDGVKLNDLLIEMREEGYFDKPLGLVEVKRVLDEKGHIYPVTTLSGNVLGMVKKRILRRMKEGKRWVYVKGSLGGS